MSKRSIKVDFNAGERPVQVLEQRALRHADQTWGGILRFKKATRVQYHRIWVSAQLPDALRVRGAAPLVSLQAPLLPPSPDGVQAELRDFPISSSTFPYSVVFDPSVIEDVLDDSLQSVDVKVHLGRLPVVSEAEEVEEFVVRLDLVKADPQSAAWIELEDVFKQGCEHRRGDHRARLGTYHVANAAPLRFAHALDCTAWIRRDALSALGAVSFGDPNEARGDVPRGTLARGTEGQLLVRGLPPGATFGIPLYVDLDRIPNPDDTAEFTVSIALQQELNERTLSGPASEETYRVLRDRRTTSLLAMLVGPDDLRPLHSDVPVALEDTVQWVPGRNGTMHCFTLRLGNSAESGSGTVEIRNLRVSFANPAGGAVAIAWKPDGGFRVNGDLADQVPPVLDFANGIGAFRDLVVSLRHSEVEALPEDVASVHCIVRFDYQELTGGAAGLNAAPPSPCRIELRFRVERDLGATWLGIDFGTSAIVVAHSAGGVGTVPLLDLQKPLMERLSEVDYNPRDVPDIGTQFLSSAIRLVDAKTLGAPGRVDSIIELAPPRRILNISPYRIPYLKSLVGTTFLPDLTGTLDGYTYHPAEGAGLVSFGTHPLTTEAVLRETYARLLADYVAPMLGASSPRKLVVTVPNNFTPRHVDQLRSLIVSRFPRFKREYVSFISESDAVACFYLANWNAMNARRPPAEREALRRGDEHVLVYDMGAGTLDLTYLRIATDGDGMRTVSIIGRMGRSTAGNYLDYLLAREIDSLWAAQTTVSAFGKWTSDAIREAQVRLKDWVQREVKPALDRDGVLEYPGELLGAGPDPLTLELAPLRDSARIREFVRASTTDVLENFFELFSSPEGMPYRMEGVPIDTVVFSGRSMQLDVLRSAVAAELRKWSGADELYVVDTLDSRTLKSSVVQGALQFAALYRRQSASSPVRINNPNLQARYGILHNHPRDPDRWAFKELLHPSTRPVSTTPVVQDGMTIFRYDTDVFDADPANDHKKNYVDLRSTPVAYFVQSFAADTAREANAGRYEYITRMAEFTAEQVGYGNNPGQVYVRVQVDDQNQMVVQLGRQTDDPTDPLRMSLLDSPTFRQSMWPLLPQDEE